MRRGKTKTDPPQNGSKLWLNLLKVTCFTHASCVDELILESFQTLKRRRPLKEDLSDLSISVPSLPGRTQGTQA